MNLIQIKQIDGLTTTLNSLAKGLFDLELEVTGQLKDLGRIYNVADVVTSGDFAMLDVFADGRIDVTTDWGVGTYSDVSFRVSNGYGLFDQGIYTNYLDVQEVNAPAGTFDSVSTTNLSIVNEFGESQDVANLFNKEYTRIGAGDFFPYELSYSDKFVSIDNSALSVGSMNMIVLPDVPDNGSEVIIQCEGTGLSRHIYGADAHSIVVAAGYSDNINGGNLFHITGDYQTAHFIKHEQGWGLKYSNYGTIEGSSEIPMPILPSTLSGINNNITTNTSLINENKNQIDEYSKWKEYDSYVSIKGGCSYMVDTCTSTVSINLPTSGDIGDEVRFLDIADCWSTHDFYVNGLIGGVNTSRTFNTKSLVRFIYRDEVSGWVDFSDILL